MHTLKHIINTYYKIFKNPQHVFWGPVQVHFHGPGSGNLFMDEVK